MDRKIAAVLVLGLAFSLVIAIINIYAAGVVIIIVITLAMSLFIMEDSKALAEVTASLSDDAKAVILTNTGNAPALKIHVTLVPMDLEYDVPLLAADETHAFALPSMAANVKVVIRFSGEKGETVSRSYLLSALEGNDPLRPMFPMFKWK